MKRLALYLVAVFAGLVIEHAAKAEVSFVGTYNTNGTTEEKTREIDGLTITFPVNQEDILEYLIPRLTLYRQTRRSAAAVEALVFREIMEEKEGDIGTLVTGLLGLEKPSADFSANYALAVQEMNRILDHWETWSGDLGHVHLYDRSTASAYWSEDRKVLDFGHIQYSFPGEGNVNMAILPPFVERIGAGIDKLNPDAKNVLAFQWDIGLYAPAGTSAKKAGDDLAQLFPVLTNLQHEVAKQLGSKWIRYYLIERMLRKEIAIAAFDENPGNHSIINGLARLYLDRFLRLSEPDRIQILFPNLVHFPVGEDPSPELFDRVESLDPLAPLAPGLEAAASRVLMLGMLKSSQSVEGNLLPFQQFKAVGVIAPPAGYNRETFADALLLAYPDITASHSKAAGEVALLMRNNTLRQGKEQPPESKQSIRLPLPDHYRRFTFGDLSITAPASLDQAVTALGPGWRQGLEEAATILRERFSQKPVPAISFEDDDYEGLKRYGVEVSEAEVTPWILQTTVSNNFERMIATLFHHNDIEIWFKDDLSQALREAGNNDRFEWNEKTGEISVNFSFSIPAGMPQESDAEQIIAQYAEQEALALPVLIADDRVMDRPIDEQIAAIHAGDYLIAKLIAGAAELSPGELAGKPTRLLDERETFFVIVHEVVEGFLIREIIGSPDRRWFCDGLANWIATQECDRRFGSGTGQEVMDAIFPPGTTAKLFEEVDLLQWKALEELNGDVSQVSGLEGAHYDLATRALSIAIAGRGPEFVDDWLERIQQTTWIRTNATTVIDAYNQLSEKDLRQILKQPAP